MEMMKSFTEEAPTLFLVATPIGNLEDITYRAVRILGEVDIIYAEDTRVSRKLLSHHGIKTKLASLHAHNEEDRADIVLQVLREGGSVALVSDAGTPLVSDPGLVLTKKVAEAGHPVVAIPGPSAFLPALVVSGLRTHPFLFYGFLPAKKEKRRRTLETLRDLPYTLLFYEAPHRVRGTLADMADILGKRRAALCRELTKRFEEVRRFRLDEASDLPDLKGEMVVVVEGGEERKQLPESDLAEHVEILIADGLPEMEAIKKVARMRKLKKNTVYMAFQNKKKRQNSKRFEE